MGGSGTGISQEKERIFRIQEFWELYKEHPDWKKERLIAKFQLSHGTSRRTVLDYIKVLVNAGKIKL